MKAVVTGGAGFIGSHLVHELINKGAKVHVMDKIRLDSLHNVHRHLDIHNVDIRSEKCKQIINHEKPDVLFHLAAQTDVNHSLNQPQHDADVNLNGTISILEACREASVKKVIFASTSA